MHTPALTEEHVNPFGFIARWWRNVKRQYAARWELDRCGDPEIAHLAQDLGISTSDLRTLAGRWPDSADLLRRRIDTLGLDATQIEPEALRDLQRVCSQCADERRCEHDFRRESGDGASDRTWRDYCPNVAALDVLRSQERDRRWGRGKPKWRSV
jgi:hypothetical protein